MIKVVVNGETLPLEEAVKRGDLTGKQAQLCKLLENLEGPHEWGYRCVADGGFIQDFAPFTAAGYIRTLEAKNSKLASHLNQCLEFIQKASSLDYKEDRTLTGIIMYCEVLKKVLEESSNV